ncbi:RRQRL motif-containing zinc-binding protein [Amycolatopsis sp. FDAARGOS 1241]|uniref:RRQRL motif-containing zinc-binding protein n=1 Tax=Amycolatopsis sp. FDAARGOS 1241 TaxID=2778070 RepID=UPI001EF19B44|nr:RRQRL motif-containing zinc-binding protein [Amycolatopsis sp. FDAARGOS 1241]
MARQHPWVLAAVAWSTDREFTRGTWCGKPLLSHGIAPRDKLATRRQLRAQGRRPGGQDPAAFLYFRCRKAAKIVYADLYLIEHAKPVRPMTPAKEAALDKAMTARRTCRECGETGWAELPRAHRTCEPCCYSAGLPPDSYLHDYLIGEPTLNAIEHAEHDERNQHARRLELAARAGAAGTTALEPAA